MTARATALLDAFQRATRLRVALDMTPRYRRRRRRRLERELAEACAAADLERHALGAPADATPLEVLLEPTVNG